MTHPAESNVLEEVLELLNENDCERYAQVLELILNQTMLIERTQAEPTSYADVRCVDFYQLPFHLKCCQFVTNVHPQ